VERSLGWHRLLRVSPMRPALYFVAKGIVTMAFGALAVALLFAFCRFAAGIEMPLGSLASLLATLALGLLPFAAIGLTLGYVLGPNSVVGVANAAFLCLAFAAGVFIPFPDLPEFVRRIAPSLPSYHLAHLGWGVVAGKPPAELWVHAAWLLGQALLFLGLARVAYQRSGARPSLQ
jgi:ABC-2 type transport system permease protein